LSPPELIESSTVCRRVHLLAAFYFSCSALEVSFEQQHKKQHHKKTRSDEKNFEKENERRFPAD
jgi:hypothetical protein